MTCVPSSGPPPDAGGHGRSCSGRFTAIGSAGPFTLVVDRPEVAGGGLGFSGGRLLYLAVAGEQLRALVALVDGLAEIPNSLRNGTAVRLGRVHVGA